MRHQRPPRIRIFSRAAESTYSWLIDWLKAGEGLGSADIRGATITNHHGDFWEEARTCDFAILYHTQNHGRLNITDVTDSLYDEELRELSHTLEKQKVIVVADDLQSDDQNEKDRILESQPSIGRYAGDLFLFTKRQKSPQNLREISRIIQSTIGINGISFTRLIFIHNVPPPSTEATLLLGSSRNVQDEACRCGVGLRSLCRGLLLLCFVLLIFIIIFGLLDLLSEHLLTGWTRTNQNAAPPWSSTPAQNWTEENPSLHKIVQDA